MPNIDKILSEALALESMEKLQLVNEILASFYVENRGVDAEWNAEVQERIAMYTKGHVPAISEDETFLKYKR